MQTPAPTQAPSPSDRPTRLVGSRIGEIEVLEENVLRFPRGMLGFEGQSDYAIVSLPHVGMESFKLLQSLNDPEIGFIVTEAASAASALNPDDLQEAYKQCDVHPSDALTLLVVSVRREAERVELSANLRAPVVIDVQRRIGRQHVMSNGAYPIRFGL